jgi:hypothetical protein
MMHPSRQAYVEEAAEVSDHQSRDDSYGSSFVHGFASHCLEPGLNLSLSLECTLSYVIFEHEANMRHLGDGHGH